MKTLAIESSCDETSVAIYDSKHGLLSNIVASQIDIHKKTGGVVPEVASRAHVEQMIPVLDEALEKAKVKLKNIDYIVVTHAPGLIGSLLTGVNTAKTLSMVFDKPILPINHLEGHIYTNFIRKNQKSKIKNQNDRATSSQIFKFPAIVLLVSGGHTSLILMKDHGKYKYLGETLDDAVGEAFDKVAKILGLEYPGGPNVSRMAEEFRKNQESRIKNYELKFPRSMIDSKDFNFSFSGLKTSVLYKWQDITKNIRMNSDKNSDQIRELFAYEFEEAVCDILASKTIKAAQKYKVKTVSICGGVSANKRLREELGRRVKNELKNVNFCIPELQYCGDNAAMIACCATYKIKKLKKGEIEKLNRLDFEIMSNKEL